MSKASAKQRYTQLKEWLLTYKKPPKTPSKKARYKAKQ